MARRARGYSVRWKEGRGYTVRFRINGQRIEKATGVRERRAKARAEEVARDVYAAHVSTPGKGRPDRRTPSSDIVEVTNQWVTSLALRPHTRKLYQKYAVYWVGEWSSMGQLTTQALARYVTARLKTTRGKTVRNELSALRRFCAWAVSEDYLGVAPEFPRVPVASGVAYHHRRRSAAPELEPSEIEALLAALPERSNRDGWPIRSRAIVAYETSLRPALLDALRVPEHYTPGSRTITVQDTLDKESFAREVPLSDRARKALDGVCPDVGLVFGAHRLDPYLAAAAKVTLPPGKAAVFTAQHFRSASLTHLLDRGAPLTAAQWMAGHRNIATTGRYVRASFRAAASAIWGTGSGDKKRKKRGK